MGGHNKKEGIDDSFDISESSLAEESKKNKESHDVVTPKSKSKELTFLYLGELGFGTRKYDTLAVEGLSLFLRKNGYTKKLTGVFMLGGLLPYVPYWYKKTAGPDMVSVAKDPEKIKRRLEGENLEEKLELITLKDLAKGDSYLSEADVKYYQTELQDGITDTHGAINSVKIEMEKLLPAFGNAEVHYQWGEEDKKKLDEEIEIIISEARKETKKKLQERFKQLENSKSILEYKLNELKKGKTLDNKEIENLQTEMAHVEEEINEADHELSAFKIEKTAIGFRKYINANQYKLFFRKAKEKRNSDLYKVVPEGMNFHVHSTAQKRIGVKWTGDLEDKKENLEEREEPAVIKISGLEIMLIHNLNLRSDVVKKTKNTIEEQKLLAKFLNKNSKLYPEICRVPDIMVSSHDAGGMRVQPQPKYSENFIEGEERETPEIVWHVKTGSFHSIPRLEYLLNRHVRDNDIRRYDAGEYASGPLIQTINKDGLCNFEFIDTSELINFGKISREIEARKQIIQKLCRRKDEESKTEVKKLKKEILELEEKVILKTKKIEVAGDYEIGVPNKLGRPSNYDFIDASQAYQRKAGLPDMVILQGDVIHGPIADYYDPRKFQYVPVPREIQNQIDKLERSRKPQKEKFLELKKICKNFVEGMPIALIDYVLEEFRLRVAPYLVNVVRNYPINSQEGKIVICSGNHITDRKTGREEATELATIIKSAVGERYENKVIPIRAIGQDEGSGQINLFGKKFFIAHKLWGGSDEMAGAMKQMRKINEDADFVVYGHKHHGMIGYADGTFFTEGFGMQTWTQYVVKIGKQDSLSGIINMNIDPNKRYCKWEFVLDPVLEKYMKR